MYTMHSQNETMKPINSDFVMQGPGEFCPKIYPIAKYRPWTLNVEVITPPQPVLQGACVSPKYLKYLLEIPVEEYYGHVNRSKFKISHVQRYQPWHRAGYKARMSYQSTSYYNTPIYLVSSEGVLILRASSFFSSTRIFVLLRASSTWPGLP